MTLACYSATSLWIATASVIVPDRAVFAIIIFGGLLPSLYVFHFGLGIVLKVPRDASEMGIG